MADLVNQSTGERTPIQLPPNFADLQAQDQAKIIEAAERLRRQKRVGRQETLGAQLPAPLAKTPGGQLAEAEIPMGTRFALGRTGGPREVDERMEVLRRKFPGLEMRKIDDPSGGELVAIRQPGTDEFVMLNSPDLVTLGDITEIGGDLFSLETLGSVIATLGSAGRNLLTKVGAQIAGATAGRGLDVAVEAARGLEKDTLTDIGKDVALSGGLAAIGEGVAAGIARPINLLLGRGAIKLTPEEEAAQQTALALQKRVGGETGGLTLGQTHPMAGVIQRQTVRTSKDAQQAVTGQLRDGLKDLQLKRNSLGDINLLDDATLTAAIRDIEQSYFQLLPLASMTADPAKGGRALNAARNTYLDLQRGKQIAPGRRSGGRLGRFYDDAIAASEFAQFDASELVELAEQFKSGVAGAGLEGEAVRLGPNLGGAEPIINRILKLDPVIRPFENATAFQQLKELRTSLFDLKNANIPGQEDPGHRVAGLLYDKITEIMEAPVGGSEDFVELMTRANRANFRHERFLDASSLVEIANASKTQSPEKLVRAIAKPGNGTQLRMMRGMFNADDWRVFQQQFKADMLSEPENIIKRLDEFRQDPRALRQLLSEDEEAALRVYGEQVANIKGGPVEAAFRKIADQQTRMVNIMETSDAAQLTKFMNTPTIGGKQSANGQAARTAMMQLIVEKSRKIGKGGVFELNPKASVDFISKLDLEGKLDAVLLPDEVAFLRNDRDLFTYFTALEDVGAALQAAQIGGKTLEFVSPTILVRPDKAIASGLSGLSDQTRNWIAGRMLTSAKLRTAVVGFGKRPLDLTSLRLLAVIGTEMTADLDLPREGVPLTEAPP